MSAARRGVSIPNFSLKPPLLEHLEYRTTYACDGGELRISCDEGVIRLIRANYGRFSISICNDVGNLDWSVNCMSYRSFLIMQDRCSQKPRCSITVSTKNFGDPCPGTLKYLEVQYHCVTAFPPTTNKPHRSTTTLATTQTYNLTSTIPETSPITTTTTIIVTKSTTTSSITPSTSSELSTQSFVINTSNNITSIGFTTTTSTSMSIRSSTNNIIDKKIVLPTTTPLLTTEIDLIPSISRDDVCQPIFASDLFWNWTKKGEEAVQKCPEGATGLARWKCGLNPVKWETESPDLRECKSIWIDNLRERMYAGNSVISVASELTQMTMSKSLFSEDLKEVTDMIQQTLTKAVTSMENFLDMWHKYHVLRELLQSIVHIVSNLLGTEQSDAWKKLTIVERRRIMSALLEGLEESALLLADTAKQEGSFSLSKPNVLLSVRVLDIRLLNTIKFPVVEELQNSNPEGTQWIRMEDSLILPAQALLDSSRHGLSKVVFTAYNRVDELLKPEPGYYPKLFQSPPSQDNMSVHNTTHIVNSRIIAASIGKRGMIRLSQPVKVTLRHLKEENVSNPSCVFWDFHAREWSSKGCWVEKSNKTFTVCACDHLTNFAVVMDVRPLEVSRKSQGMTKMIITIGCAIAIIFFLIMVITFQILRNLKGDTMTIHKNLFLCLLISEIVFVSGIKWTSNTIFCSIIAGVLHYFFLTAFTWIFFEGFQLYVMLIEIFEVDKSRTRWYYLLAYGVPGLIVAIAAIIDPNSYGTSEYCWLRADNYFIFSFVGPAVGILFGGAVFLCIAACILCHHSSISASIKGKEEAKLASIKSWIRWAIIYMILLGLTWTSGLLYVNEETIFLAYAFAVLNSLQALFAIIFYCIKNEKVQEEYRKLTSNLRWMPNCFRKPKAPEHLNNCQRQSFRTQPSGEHSESQHHWSSHMDKSCPVIPTYTIQGHPSTSALTTQKDEECQRPKMQLENSEVAHSPQWRTKLKSNSPPSAPPPIADNSTTFVTLSSQWPQLVQQQHRHSPYRHYSLASDNTGQYADHIYESIEDDPTSLIENHHMPLNVQQYSQMESFYGDHSDLSQHSSSSYGYDQRPLLITNLPPRQESAKLYGVSQGYPVTPSPDMQRHRHEKIYGSHRRKSSERRPSGLSNRRAYAPSPLSSQDFVPSENLPTKAHLPSVIDSDTPDWGPVLPDLLRCPKDNMVVMAVMDGEKVIHCLQPETVEPKYQTHHKLSTYC